MNNSICTLFDNILIDIHKFKSLHKIFWIRRKVIKKDSIILSLESIKCTGRFATVVKPPFVIAFPFLLSFKCRKNVGYTCKYPALFVPLPSIYKQKTYV